MKKKHWTMIVPGAVLLSASPAFGVELRDAVQQALSTNPQIRQAVANRLATQEERVQATGLYYPRISVEGSAGVRSLRNPTRRAIGLADQTLYPIEGDLIVDQLVYDSGGREAEIRRQASRTDAAAARVEERSEYVALNVSRTYIDYLLQQRLVAIAQDNVTFHERLVGDLREGVSKGSISIADQQQAEERLQAARARVTEARADLDTAREDTRAAKAKIGPRLNLEGRARAGHDIDGFAGRTTDLQALAVRRWDLYNGGIKEANYREQLNRADEVHGR